MQSRLWAAGLVAVFAAVACGSSWSAPASYTLRYKFRPGQELRYSIRYNVTVTMPGQTAGAGAPSMGGTGTVILRVQKVNPDGTAQVAATASGFTATGMAPQPSFRDRTAVFVMTPQGRIVTGALPFAGVSRSVAGPLVSPDMFATAAAQLPAHPVRVGDKWTASQPNVTKTSPPIRISSQLAGVKSVGADKQARILQQFVVPLNAIVKQQGGSTTVKMKGTLRINGTNLFAINAGRSTSSTVDGGGLVNVLPTGNQTKNAAPLPLKMKIISSMKLVK